MKTVIRVLLTASLLALPASPLLAQTAGPSGHWEGSLQAGPTIVPIEVDLGTNAKGDLAGTFGQPEQQVKGLPLSMVAASGTSVRFVLHGNAGPATFDGTLAADGQWIRGEASQGGNVMPFTLKRTGDARFAPAPKSTRIGPELEGTWSGMMDVGGRAERLVLKLANQADGTAAGTVVDRDGSGVEIPIGITQKGASVTIDIPSVGGVYAAVLNAGAEMVGTWSQATVSLPLTFQRVSK